MPPGSIDLDPTSFVATAPLLVPMLLCIGRDFACAVSCAVPRGTTSLRPDRSALDIVRVGDPVTVCVMSIIINTCDPRTHHALMLQLNHGLCVCALNSWSKTPGNSLTRVVSSVSQMVHFFNLAQQPSAANNMETHQCDCDHKQCNKQHFRACAPELHRASRKRPLSWQNCWDRKKSAVIMHARAQVHLDGTALL